jgi:hypothetical protein
MVTFCLVGMQDDTMPRKSWIVTGEGEECEMCLVGVFARRAVETLLITTYLSRADVGVEGVRRDVSAHVTELYTITIDTP